ncbi:Gfo/Idh/MocA family oxidoreductase [Salinactinospora qingdaonensis]|uniref:Gfo/Idh/MocA family oxidoreductase n=1 Tax=Salinactinospora qingdaonensis TaxID=702744 RepID=UPI0031E644BF
MTEADPPTGRRRPRVVVCGTKFGQVYLEAFRDPSLPFDLVGVLGQGSARSTSVARHYGVPLFTDVDELPDDVDMACVVVRGGLLGGPGVDIAKRLMSRGIHVVQEHPLHYDELADCLRHARQNRVVYHLNSFYPHQAPVRRFIAAARELLGRQRARYVDGACGFQVAYAMLDILGQSLGGVRPWGLADPPEPSSRLAGMLNKGLDVPFRSLDGVVAGVPLTLRVHNQLDPADPDGYAHLMHRVTIATEAGALTLVDTHGPTVWCPRPDFPKEVRESDVRPHFQDSPNVFGDHGDHFDVPSTVVLGPATAPSYRAAFESVWPAGVARALDELWQAAQRGDSPLPRGQYHLGLCQLWQDITAKLGPPDLVRAEPIAHLRPDDVATLAEAAEAANAADTANTEVRA